MLLFHVRMLAGTWSDRHGLALLREDEGNYGGVVGRNFMYGDVFNGMPAEYFGGEFPGMIADVCQVHWLGKGADA